MRYNIDISIIRLSRVMGGEGRGRGNSKTRFVTCARARAPRLERAHRARIINVNNPLSALPLIRHDSPNDIWHYRNTDDRSSSRESRVLSRKHKSISLPVLFPAFVFNLVICTSQVFHQNGIKRVMFPQSVRLLLHVCSCTRSIDLVTDESRLTYSRLSRSIE